MFTTWLVILNFIPFVPSSVTTLQFWTFFLITFIKFIFVKLLHLITLNKLTFNTVIWQIVAPNIRWALSFAWDCIVLMLCSRPSLFCVYEIAKSLVYFNYNAWLIYYYVTTAWCLFLQWNRTCQNCHTALTFKCSDNQVNRFKRDQCKVGFCVHKWHQLNRV